MNIHFTSSCKCDNFTIHTNIFISNLLLTFLVMMNDDLYSKMLSLSRFCLIIKEKKSKIFTFVHSSVK